MKKHITIMTCSAVLALGLNSCKNPADDTQDAVVKEAEVAVEAKEGVKYMFTENSKIGFVGSKVTGSHGGGFKKFEGYFMMEDDEPKAGEFVIDMDSTWSDNEKLTGHLKAPDFFDVEKFPESKFEVTEFAKNAEGGYDLSGNLTLHGETKNITFATTVTKGEGTVQVKAKFDINRKDFGIVYPGKPDDLIRDEVVIEFDLEAKVAS